MENHLIIGSLVSINFHNLRNAQINYESLVNLTDSTTDNTDETADTTDHTTDES